jgi:4-amino-4-deoxy-L-arabinose transferase-like glycosyltransferase
VRLIGELREWWRDEPRDYRVALAWITIAGIALRLASLGQPMRYDESVTYMEFVRLSVSEALSSYTYPNNHLFHTLVVKASVALFGNSPVALRLPSLLAGIVVIPLSYAAIRSLYGARVALIAAAVVASSGILALFATNARGYSMMLLAFVVLILLAARLVRAPTVKLWTVFAVTAALGMWTVPVMLFPLGSVALWLALSFAVDGRKRDLVSLAGSLAAAAALTLAAYSPILLRSGLAALVGNRFVAPSPWTDFLNDMFISGWITLRSWSLGIPPIAFMALIGVGVFGFVRQARHSAFRVSLPLAAFVWCSWLLVVTHRAPHPRMWLWCLPLLGALLGLGVVELFERSKRLATRLPVISTAIAIVGVVAVIASNAVLRARDTGTFPESELIASGLAGTLKPGDRVLAAVPTNGPLAYHFHRLGVDPKVLAIEEAEADRLIVVVNAAEGETLEDVVQGAADTSQFVTTVIADRPLTKVFMFQRKNAP